MRRKEGNSRAFPSGLQSRTAGGATHVGAATGGLYGARPKLRWAAPERAPVT